MRCVLIIQAEDADELNSELVGTWELIPLPDATWERLQTSNSQAVP